MRSETIIELARWDFDLGVQLLESWSGETSDLMALCRERSDRGDFVAKLPLGNGPAPSKPPEALLDAWDRAQVDVWHDGVSQAPSLLLRNRNALNSLLWAAQARVLLPWIELRRSRLEAELTASLGKARFDSAVKQFADPEFDPRDPDFIPEVGLLHVIAGARVGASDPRLRDLARVLWTARNHLAHLRPLSPAAQEELVRVGAWAR